MAARAPGACRRPRLPRRDALRVARVLAPVPVDARAAAARLPALPRRQRQDRQGSADVRALAVDHRPLSRARRPVLRREQAPVDPEGRDQHAALGLRHGRLLRGVRHHPRPRGDRRDHHRLAHLPRRVVRAEPRPHLTAAHVGERHLRAESLPQGHVRLLRDAPDDRVDAGGAPGAEADSRGVRVRGCRLPLSGERALGRASRELHAGGRGADRVRGRERGGEDDAHQAAGASLRPHGGTHSPRRRGPPRVRPGVGAPRDRRHLPGLRPLRHALRREHRRRRDRRGARLPRALGERQLVGGAGA